MSWIAGFAEREFGSRLRVPHALAILDGDRVHALNARLGYAHVDAVLEQILAVAQERVRGYDGQAARLGDEFVLITPARQVEAMRSAIADMRKVAAEGHMSLSVGVAVGSGTEVVARADTEMFRSKKDSRRQRGDLGGESPTERHG